MLEVFRLRRGKAGTFEPADFALVLVLYALSGTHTLRLFFFLLAPFAALFARTVGRRALPKASTLSRFLKDCTDEAVETVREMLFRDLLAHGLRGDSLGGLVDRTSTPSSFLKSMRTAQRKP